MHRHYTNTILDMGEMEAVRTAGSMAGSGGCKASWETRSGSGSDVGAVWTGGGTLVPEHIDGQNPELVVIINFHRRLGASLPPEVI